jgi:hypothetical protein
VQSIEQPEKSTMDDLKALADTNSRLAQPEMRPTELIASVRREHPNAARRTLPALHFMPSFARAAATNSATANPRILKGPFSLVNGGIYQSGATPTSVYFRVSLTTTLTAGGPAQQGSEM